MLQQAQITSGIITNGHAEVQRAKLAAIEAKSLFPIILVGHEEITAGRCDALLAGHTTSAGHRRQSCVHGLAYVFVC